MVKKKTKKVPTIDIKAYPKDIIAKLNNFLVTTHGLIPLTFVIPIGPDDRRIIERIKADRTLAKKFTLSTLQPVDLATLDLAKVGTLYLTSKEAQ